jgi:hypothetical protein
MSNLKFMVFDNDGDGSVFTLQDIQSGKVQFTGDCHVVLSSGETDKDGKEVFEGNVLKCHYTGELYKVMYGKFSISHDFTGVGFYLLGDDGVPESFSLYNKSVIGHIVANPKLLK